MGFWDFLSSREVKKREEFIDSMDKQELDTQVKTFIERIEQFGGHVDKVEYGFGSGFASKTLHRVQINYRSRKYVPVVEVKEIQVYEVGELRKFKSKYSHYITLEPVVYKKISAGKFEQISDGGEQILLDHYSMKIKDLEIIISGYLIKNIFEIDSVTAKPDFENPSVFIPEKYRIILADSAIKELKKYISKKLAE